MSLQLQYVQFLMECCSPLRGAGGWVHQITKSLCNGIRCIKLSGAESLGSPDGWPPLTWYGHNNVTEDPFGVAVPLSFKNPAHSKNLEIGVEPLLFLGWGWTWKFAKLFMVLECWMKNFPSEIWIYSNLQETISIEIYIFWYTHNQVCS